MMYCLTKTAIGNRQYMFNDIFKPQDVKDVDAKFKTAELTMQVASDRARLCLNYESFKTYRDSFKRAEAALMDALIAYNNQFSMSESGDVYKYAMKVNRLLTKAQDVRELLNTVESHAKRGMSKGATNEK